MKTIKKIKIIIFIIILASKLYSNSAIESLKNDVSATIVSMAGAGAVTNKDIFSINYNPATMGELKDMHIAFNYSGGFEDAKYSFIAFGFPLHLSIISEAQTKKSDSSSYLGFSIYTANLGDIIYRKINNDESITEQTFQAQKDIILTAAYGEKIHKENIIFTKNLKSDFESSIGIGIKFVNSKLIEEYSANTISFDAGYYGSFKDIGVSFGISYSNITGKIKYISQKDPLPGILRTGISYEKFLTSTKIKTSLDFTRYTTDKKNSLQLGAELLFNNFSIRSGYKFLDDNNGIAAGIGINAQNKFEINLASTFYSLYKFTSISIKYSFGKTKVEPQTPKPQQPLKKIYEKKEIKPSQPTTKPIMVF